MHVVCLFDLYWGSANGASGICVHGAGGCGQLSGGGLACPGVDTGLDTGTAYGPVATAKITENGAMAVPAMAGAWIA